MADGKVTYEISLKDGITPKLKRIKDGFDGVEKEVDQTKKKVKGLSSTFKGLGGAIAGAIGTAAVIGFTKHIVELEAQVQGLNNALLFASGSELEFGRNSQFVSGLSDKLGLDLLTAQKGFTKLAASSKGTTLEGNKTRELFEALSQATTTLGLSNDEANGSLVALSQIISKGKLSAEELRQQLGERLPGAFQIAARSMGVTTSELDKMLSNGEILSEDFLPKFTKELQKTFGSDTERAAKSLRSTMNRFNNEVLKLKLRISDTITPFLTAALKLGAAFLKNESAMKAFVGAIAGAAIGAAGWAIGAGIATAATWTFTGSIAALTAVMAANPIGLIAVAVGALVGALVFAWNESETFRSVVLGLWASLKVLGVGIKKFFQPIIDTLSFAMSKMIDFFKSETVAKFTSGIKKMGGAVLDFLLAPINLAIEAIKAITSSELFKESSLGKAIEGIGEKAGSAFEKARLGELEKTRQKREFDKISLSQLLGSGDNNNAAASAGGTGDLGKNVKLGETNGIKSQKPTVINVSIDSLVKELMLTSQTVTEGATQIKEEVTKQLLLAINDATLAVE